MAADLRERLLRAFIRIRKTTLHFPSCVNLHLTELFAMGKITRSDSEKGISGLELQHDLHINKSAVSQMLGALVQKGYVERKTNENDRRKMVVCVTPAGKNAMDAMRKHANHTTSEIISRFGDEKTEQLIQLFNEFADIFEEVQAELLSQKTENVKKEDTTEKGLN